MHLLVVIGILIRILGFRAFSSTTKPKLIEQNKTSVNQELSNFKTRYYITELNVTLFVKNHKLLLKNSVVKNFALLKLKASTIKR